MMSGINQDIRGRKPLRAESTSPTRQRNYSAAYNESTFESSGDASSSATPLNSRFDSSLEETNFTNESIDVSRQPRKTNFANESIDVSQQPQNTSGVNKYVLALLTVTILVFLLARQNIFLSAKQNQVSSSSCSYEDLKKMYPNETQKVWDALSVGINNIINDESKLGVYLFLHQNEDYARDFVETIAQRSSKCFGEDMKPVQMDKKKLLAKNDYGEIIEYFKEITERTQVVLFGNLNELPAENARALHAICDTYSPLRNKIVIFFTLKPASVKGSPKKRAEATLFKIWRNEVDDNHLDALITRVTDDVIQLEGEIKSKG